MRQRRATVASSGGFPGSKIIRHYKALVEPNTVCGGYLADLPAIFVKTRRRVKSDPSKAGDHAESWLTFGDRGVFDAQARKIKMNYNWDARNLNFRLNRAELSRRGQLAFCPSAQSPDSAGRALRALQPQGFRPRV